MLHSRGRIYGIGPTEDAAIANAAGKEIPVEDAAEACGRVSQVFPAKNQTVTEQFQREQEAKIAADPKLQARIREELSAEKINVAELRLVAREWKLSELDGEWDCPGCGKMFTRCACPDLALAALPALLRVVEVAQWTTDTDDLRELASRAAVLLDALAPFDFTDKGDAAAQESGNRND